MDSRQIAERFVLAIQGQDHEALDELVHPEIVTRYPQSGETIRGRENLRRMLTDYPIGLPKGQVSSMRSSSNTAVVSPSLPFMPPTVTVYGGDQLVVEGVLTYPNGEVFNIVMLLRLQGGQVIEETTYFAPPFDPPEWRRAFVEMEEVESDKPLHHT